MFGFRKFGFGYVRFWICSVLDMFGFGRWICSVLVGRYVWFWICSVGGYVRFW